MTPIEPVPASYNPATDPAPLTSWDHVENTTHARWYPSMVSLADGRIIMVGGGSNFVELLDGDSWTDIQTKPQMYIDANTSMMLYPSLALLPSGLVFMHGSEDADATNSPLVRAGVFLDPDANPNPGPGEFRGAWVGPRVLPSTQHGPTGGYAVMYEPGKIMRAGGGSRSGTTNNTIENECVGEFPNVVTEIVDLSDPIGFFGEEPDRHWTRVGDMNTKRHFHNLVLLPTGEVLAIGGVECDNGQSHHVEDDTLNIAHWATKSAEKWDPDTGLWCELAAQDRPRMYHSTALLLPNGRVLSMGGGRRQGTISEMNAEVFTPPYLLGQENNRPILLSATPLSYGAAFTVTLDPSSPMGWDQVDRLTLVKLAATTHGNDMGQQFQTLGAPRIVSAAVASVPAPTSPNEASPGWYMLFAISAQGVPSGGIYVNLNPVP
jgi:hypothetical protein